MSYYIIKISVTYIRFQNRILQIIGFMYCKENQKQE